MTDLLNSRSETPSICCVNLTVQLKLQTQKLGFVHWRLSQYVLSQSCRTWHSVLEVYGWMFLCNAHSDVLKSSPSLSASSFKLCCTVRHLRVTHSGNHPRYTLQRRCADALWQPPTSPPHKTSQPMTGILYTTFFPQVSLWISSAASTIALTIHSDGHHSCLLRHLSHRYFEVQFKK